MTQRLLDKAVARATGESIATIRRIGFGLATGEEPSDEAETATATKTQEAPRVSAA
jgi:hypothetical protein